jgi:hypothetical protein
MIDNAVAEVARTAAKELVPRYGPQLAADIEAAIYATGRQRAREPIPAEQYLDPVALGALIVSIAQFGYQVYNDRKAKGQQPTCGAITQAIQIKRRKHGDLTDEETEIIGIVSAKIIERDGGELPGLDMPWTDSPRRPRCQAPQRPTRDQSSRDRPGRGLRLRRVDTAEADPP